MGTILLEVCVDNLQSVKNAVKCGAKRIELCSCLFKGGLTPSAGLLALTKKVAKTIPVYVMLRARLGNDFVFTKDEQKVMMADLKMLKQIGADGFVYGALNEDGTVNTEFCTAIVNEASPLPVTFHRAFDNVKDDMEALDAIINIGFLRILTSGREKSAADTNACDRLKHYVDHAQDKIVIMAGAGITAHNIDNVLQTGVKEVHGSFKMHKDLPVLKHMEERGGRKEVIDVTDEKHLKSVVKILQNFSRK